MKLACATAVAAAFALTAPALAATLAPVEKLSTPSDRAPDLFAGPGGTDVPGRISSLLADNPQATSLLDRRSHNRAPGGDAMPPDLLGPPGTLLPFLWGTD